MKIGDNVLVKDPEGNEIGVRVEEIDEKGGLFYGGLACGDLPVGCWFCMTAIVKKEG